MKKQQTILKTICALSLFSLLPSSLLAQTVGQNASVEFISGDISIEAPASIDFSPQFISSSPQQVQTFQDPTNPNESIIVTDGRNSGDFSVDIRVSDLVSENNDIIPHYNFKILTLSEANAPQTVDIFPPSAPTDVSAPLDYDWDFSSQVNSLSFEAVSNSGIDTSNPITIIDGINPLAERIGQYSLALGLEIDILALHPSGSYQGEITVTLNT